MLQPAPAVRIGSANRRPLSVTSSCPSPLRAPVRQRLLLLGGELEGKRVHAVPVAGGGSEAVGEHVAQVRSAVGAAHLGTGHPERVVLEQLNCFGAHRLVEARPAASGIKLGAALEQFRVAGRTGECSGAFLVEQLTRPRAFCPRLAEHFVTLSSEFFAPLFFGLLHLVSHDSSLSLLLLSQSKTPVVGNLFRVVASTCRRTGREVRLT